MDSLKLINAAKQAAKGKEATDYVNKMIEIYEEDGRLNDRQKMLLERIVSKGQEVER